MRRLITKCYLFTFFATILCFYEVKAIAKLENNSLHGHKSAADGWRKPLVLIPGLMGSHLEARLRKEHAYKNCPTNKDWFTLWFDAKQLIPGHIDCWVDNTRLVYNNDSASLKNSPGVETRIPNFGSTVAFEYLDDSTINFVKYFSPLVDFLVESLGYKRGLDLFGAPYDWRLSPRQHKEMFQKLALLIEKASHLNKKKVVILSHSLGGPFSNFFLNSQTLEWRRKFIDSFVSVSGSFYGSIKSLKALVSGDAEGFEWVVDVRQIQRLVRTFPSFLYMVPRTSLWPKDKKTVVVTSIRNYTVVDYHNLFKDIGCKWCWDLYRAANVNMIDVKAPRVPTHCIFSSGLPTMETLIYETKFPNFYPKYTYGDGDGTINLWSASACSGWKKKQSEPVYNFQLHRLSHIQILWDSALHKYLASVLTAH